ncbi:MAG: peptidase U32 family protein [Promethearchaeota archaeon]
MNQFRQVELLLPAQNKKSIIAVKKYANAVYFGTESLNMRINADNFMLKNLPEVVDLCHSLNLKAYLTTNVIIYENELDYLENQLNLAKDAGIDAVIVHDLAAIEIATEINLPFHISTQASVSNAKAARFFERLGAERIILARELTLDQIKTIIGKLNTTQIETFVHGAMCTAISGRCYLSAEVHKDTQYSANRGNCLQPCRNKWTIIHSNGTELEYEDGFFLNSKDLCMIEYIPELIEAKISSFKIEGRMRDPHYIETVGQCYREAIDSYFAGTYNEDKVKIWLDRLKTVYNRGFSTGFYFDRPNVNDISREKSGNLSNYKKIQIGKVITYYRNVKAAKISLYQGQLRIGDEVIFEGSKMGTYLRQKITSIQIKTKAVTQTPKIKPGTSILISITVDSPVKKNDYLYRYLPR